MKLSRSTLCIFIVMICLVLILTACSPDQQDQLATQNFSSDNQPVQTVKAPEETQMKVEPTRIQANTQLTYKDLKIGAGNFWEEEYTNEQNETLKGLTAGLWIYVKDQPQEDKTLRVFPGMNIDVAGYQIKIVSVFQENGNKFVELIIEN